MAKIKTVEQAIDYLNVEREADIDNVSGNKWLLLFRSDNDDNLIESTLPIKDDKELIEYANELQEDFI